MTRRRVPASCRSQLRARQITYSFTILLHREILNRRTNGITLPVTAVQCLFLTGIISEIQAELRIYELSLFNAIEILFKPISTVLFRQRVMV